MKKGRSSQSQTGKRNLSLPRQSMLKGREPFQRLFEERARHIKRKHVRLRFQLFKNEDPVFRIGFIVRKKLGNAVKRNRVKRLLKEAFRLNQYKLSDLIQENGLRFHGVLIANTIDLDFQSAAQEVAEMLDDLRHHFNSVTDL